MAQQELEIVVHYSNEVTEDYLSSEITKHNLKESAPGEIGDLVFDPLTAMVVVGGVTSLAHLIVSLIDRWRGGTVVDQTGGKPDVRRDNNLPLGWMLILAKDGEVRLEAKDIPRDGLERIVEKVLQLGKDAGTAAIEAAVNAAKSIAERTRTAER